MSYICEIEGTGSVQIAVNMNDVKDIVESMGEEQLEELKDIIGYQYKPKPTKGYYRVKRTLEDRSKRALLDRVMEKYSLDDLEKLLGTEYDLL